MPEFGNNKRGTRWFHATGWQILRDAGRSALHISRVETRHFWPRNPHFWPLSAEFALTPGYRPL